jgi:hypothetical protein
MAQDASKGRLGLITRRIFVGGLAGVGLMRDSLVLEAVAAERMPHRMVVRGVARSAFFELRDYGAACPRLMTVLKRHGIRAVWAENGRFLIPFETLAARERAWREVSADAEWIGFEAAVREIAVYRAVI